MKYKFSILIFHLLFSCKIVLPQINFYDSVITVAFSASYEFKNPAFDNMVQGFSVINWLAYERHFNGSSDMIIRKVNFNDYGPEIVLTDTGNYLNLNPSLNKSFLVWQTNQRGNWDLCFSVFTNNSFWISPLIIDSSLTDETAPNILFNNSSSGNYFLVYKKNNNIGFKRYNAGANIWDQDTVLTSGDSTYSSPLLFRQNTSTGYCIAYLKIDPAGRSILFQRLFNETISGNIIWHEPFIVQQPNSQENLTSSISGSQNITYSYDTLGNKNIIGFQVDGGTLKEIFTRNVPGNHYYGKGSLMGILTDNPYFHFSVFCSLTKTNDSTQITFINRPGSFNNNPQYKKLYLGDTSIAARLDLSAPIFQLSGGGPYRIKAVWEKDINGKTALVESYMTDILNNLNNQNLIVKDFILYQNYPNPFNPVTVISYSIPSDVKGQTSNVKLIVFNNLGKQVATLVNEEQKAGSYNYQFSTVNYQLSSGIYFYKLEAGDYSEVKRMILLK